MPIPIERFDEEPCVGVPWISLEGWMKHLVAKQEINTLFGSLGPEQARSALRQYWTLLRPLEPDLKIWDMFDAGEADPEFTIPMSAHLDEGRGASAC